MLWFKNNKKPRNNVDKKTNKNKSIKKQGSYNVGNHKNYFLTFLYWIKKLSILKHILFFYFLITIIGSIILYLPISQKQGVHVGFIDSLFTSASAFSDTGLVTKTTSLTWSWFGQAVIAILILIGGIGWFAIKVFFFNYLFNRPIGMLARRVLDAERGNNVVGDTKKIIKFSVSCIMITIIISSIVMMLFFYYSQGEFEHTPWTVKNKVVDNSSFFISENPKDINLTNAKIPKNIIDNIYSWDKIINTSHYFKGGNFQNGLYASLYPGGKMPVDNHLVINNLQKIYESHNSTALHSQLNNYVSDILKIRSKNVGILKNVDNSAFDPHHNWALSIKYGIFHSISAINNAGFDILSQNSMAPYYKNYFIQIWIILLFVMGGVGYPVLFDISRYISAKRNNKTNFKWSLFTKISCITYLLISLIGIAMTFGIEMSASSTATNTTFWDNVKSNKLGSKGSGVMALIFNTLSTRNAGFATINTYSYTSTTLIVHSIMMFFGSAPSSTAGGIRTTTLAIIFMGIWASIKNKTSVRAFNRRIPKETVIRSYIVFSVGMILVIIGTIVGTTSFTNFGGSINDISHNPNTSSYYNSHYPTYSFIHIWFEVSSAFGTTGLSVGLTSQLNTASKLIIIFIMFIGQLGVSSTILVWGNRLQKSRHYKYIKEDVLIG